ncbi:hypothetical protein [Burkholderia seminalis]|uniref:hypothetical protein n=1 Tax=Burkholderia seminalis TaxID=488731 RepID=UPI001904FDFF|nr:hypothetical protein [Burkholderia seminalis]MBJ9964456.1 hypothetical protein [Burkholderia seminalis]
MSKELERLRELEKTVQKLFKAAAAEGLYVGCGYTTKLPRSAQEGPIVKQIKKLARVED